ncbi:MAG TPA: c(7)-type cytochrome triheme domain-containing protein, partial [Nitrospirota bacterium]|nr:c(7)-type cytochrome triheme domain-containing protein [Nitrospirota bacterium]
MRKLVLILAIFLLVSAGAEAKTPIKKKIPLPEEYGRVVISNYSEKAGLAPVVFDHWLHRSMFTCRLCHIDIGFAMKEDGSDIKAADNMKGFYCGTCHNGKKTYKGKAVFESCSNSVLRNDTGKCERCHLLGKKVKKEYDFSDFTEKFPKGRLGNRIDWEKAEDEGIIKPVDYIEGISAARPAFKTQKDINIGTKGGWMSE